MSSYRSLRVWPAVVFLIGMVVLRYVPAVFEDGPSTIWMASAFGPAICGIAILLWWLIGSRATARERWVGFFGVLVAIVLTEIFVHHTMLGPATTMLTIPMATAAFAIVLMLGRNGRTFRRTSMALGLAALASSYSMLLRSEGMWGSDLSNAYAWRWSPSAEERLLQSAPSTTPSGDISDSWFVGLTKPEWPGFRGGDRTGVHRGSRLSSDWETQPPELVWKVPVGPGWSSFAVASPLLFTQDQWGDLESVVCLHAESGAEVWKHSIESRFEEPLGGPGPRATPTLDQGSLFVQGAQGWLFRLDAKTGQEIWKQDLRKVADRKAPMWGFASSPLVVGSSVIVYAGGVDDKGTLAFDRESGDLKWGASAGNDSYASAHLCTFQGRSLASIATNRGMDLLDPATGELVLKYEWPHKGYRCLQPILPGDDTMVILTGQGSGTRRIRVSGTGRTGPLQAEELWTTRRLKPDFNDAVSFEGNVYGFDNSIFTCIDLETGERQWKGGRYGKGQVLLLQDSRMLLIAAERGEVVLLKATPEAHTELARFQALEGKTWNHPVVVGNRLYIRNGEEAACYVLPLE